MTRSSAGSSSPVVVLIEPDRCQHHHADVMSKAGFVVVSVPAHRASVNHVLDQRPSVVAAELSAAHAGRTWAFVRRLRQHDDARFIPCIVYGHRLQADDIETATRAGVLWLELEPSAGARLVAAARGLLAAGGKRKLA